MASMLSIGSLAGAATAAASAFSGILDTDLSKVAGLKSMNKKDLLDSLQALETDADTKYTEYEDWTGDLDEEIK